MSFARRFVDSPWFPISLVVAVVIWIASVHERRGTNQQRLDVGERACLQLREVLEGARERDRKLGHGELKKAQEDYYSTSLARLGDCKPKENK